ncbi:MAG: hypothetical protein JWO45_40 [Spartobacteria bacterium]|nr:hypothetical protein [Spartobacteria bacterium]
MEAGALRRQVALDSQKIGEQLFSFRGQDGFRVELNAVHRKLPMLQSHDFGIVSFSGDFEKFRQRFPADDQGMVSGGLEGLRDLREDAVTGMMNDRCFAVHQFLGLNDLSAERVCDTLMTKTHAEDGYLRAQFANDLFTNASGFGTTWPW